MTAGVCASCQSPCVSKLLSSLSTHSFCPGAGIVYISRIPPHMVRSSLRCARNICHAVAAFASALTRAFLALQKPQKLRQMLAQHGEVSRIYLAPEGARLH